MPLVYLTQVSALMDVKRGWMYCQLTAATEPKPNAVYNLKDSHNKCVSKGFLALHGDTLTPEQLWVFYLQQML